MVAILVSHITDRIKRVNKEMTAYEVCLHLYKLGDYLDSDTICDAALLGLDSNNKARVTMYHQLRAKPTEVAEAALRAFFEFREAFVGCAKIAYSYPRRKSSGPNTYTLSQGHGVINLGPRGITAPFIHLMLCFREHFLTSPSTIDFIRRLQEVPELLVDILITFVTPSKKAKPESSGSDSSGSDSSSDSSGTDSSGSGSDESTDSDES